MLVLAKFARYYLEGHEWKPQQFSLQDGKFGSAHTELKFSQAELDVLTKFVVKMSAEVNPLANSWHEF
jgi:hypothetical protein